MGTSRTPSQPVTSTHDEWLSLEEVANLLAPRPQTVYALLHSGELLARKQGRSWMVCAADFEDWVDRRYEATWLTQKQARRHPDVSPNVWRVGPAGPSSSGRAGRDPRRS